VIGSVQDFPNVPISSSLNQHVVLQYSSSLTGENNIPVMKNENEILIEKINFLLLKFFTSFQPVFLHSFSLLDYQRAKFSLK
jgi:hypothetical protein